jgi:hypothetical protein
MLHISFIVMGVCRDAILKQTVRACCDKNVQVVNSGYYCEETITSRECKELRGVYSTCCSGDDLNTTCPTWGDEKTKVKRDVVIVGSGPGGIGAIFGASDRNFDTLVLERGRRPTVLKRELNEAIGDNIFMTQGGSAFQMVTAGIEPLPVLVREATLFNKTLNPDFGALALGGLWTANGAYWTTQPSQWKNFEREWPYEKPLRERQGLTYMKQDGTPLDQYLDTSGLNIWNEVATFLKGAGQQAERLTIEDRWPSNVDVMMNANIDRLKLTHRDGLVKCTGIVLDDGREIETDTCVLSAGYADTPAILQRSGIGPRQLLESLEIPIELDLPVGEGLANEASINFLAYVDGVQFDPSYLVGGVTTDDRVLFALQRFNVSDVLPFLDTADTGTVMVFSVTAANGLIENNQKIRGHVRIRSKDPAVAPEIDFGTPVDDATIDAMQGMSLRIKDFFMNMGNLTAGKARMPEYTALEGFLTNFGVVPNPEFPDGILFGYVNTASIPGGYPEFSREALYKTLVESGDHPYHGCGTLYDLVDRETFRLQGTQNIYIADASTERHFTGSAASLYSSRAYKIMMDMP